MNLNNIFSFFNFFPKSSFQDTATPIMEGIVDLHNHVFFYLIVIFISVSFIFATILLKFYYSIFNPRTVSDFATRFYAVKANNVTHGQLLEIIWTIIPSGILILIVIPSFALLYSMDEVLTPVITLKVLGHQWYWTYEYKIPELSESPYTEDNGIEITNNMTKFFHVSNRDSYMIPEAELEVGQHRLLTVDEPCVVPINTHVRVIVTADDVLHSWAVPSLGVKIDAVPGRLSQVFLFIKRAGTFYGQCSELCGVNHGFMPIAVIACEVEEFFDWLVSNNENN